MRGRLKNRIISTLVIGTLLLANTAAFAADEGVTFRGDTREVEIQGTGSDLFGAMKGMMPGDVKTQVIQLNNNSSQNAIFYIYAKDAVLGEDAKAQSDALLALLQLKVSVTLPNSQEVVLYQGKASGSNGNDQSSMREPITIGSVGANGQAIIKAELIAPQELGNQFQNAIGYIDWVFYCELTDESPGGGGGNSGDGDSDGGDPSVPPPTIPEETIDDNDVPMGNTDTSTNIDEDIINITDGEIPGGPAPGGFIVVDQDTLGNLPKTGNVINYLDEIGLLLIVLCAGLLVINTIEKRRVK